MRYKLPSVFKSKKILLFSWGAVTILLVGVVTGLLIVRNNNQKQSIGLDTSSSSNSANEKTGQNTTSPISTTNPSSSSTTTTPTNTQHLSAPTATPTQNPPQESATLPNCTYSNGPQAGQHCPQTAPSSYSYSNHYPYSCYMPDPSNPGYVTNYPGDCPPYTDVVSIVGKYDSGMAYCEFDYATYNGTSGISKSDRVDTYSSALPDCSTAQLYY